MLPVERQSRIVDLLREQNVLKVESIAKLFQVSDMTVRRDFEKLEKAGVAKRCYGGLSLCPEITLDVDFQQRAGFNLDAKEAIASYCYEHFMGNHQFIYLDAGSTVLQLARMLRKKHPENLTVVTNDIFIASTLSDTDIEIIMMGGRVQHGLGCVHGHTAEDQLEDLHMDVAFVSGLAVDANFDLYAATENKVHFRNKLLEKCSCAYMLLDSTKMNKQSIYCTHNLSEYTATISDKVLSPEELALAQEKNIHWIHL